MKQQDSDLGCWRTRQRLLFCNWVQKPRALTNPKQELFFSRWCLFVYLNSWSSWDDLNTAILAWPIMQGLLDLHSRRWRVICVNSWPVALRCSWDDILSSLGLISIDLPVLRWLMLFCPDCLNICELRCSWQPRPSSSGETHSLLSGPFLLLFCVFLRGSSNWLLFLGCSNTFFVLI